MIRLAVSILTDHTTVCNAYRGKAIGYYFPQTGETYHVSFPTPYTHFPSSEFCSSNDTYDRVDGAAYSHWMVATEGRPGVLDVGRCGWW